MDSDREASMMPVPERREHPLLVVCRTIVGACGGALVGLAAVVVPTIASELGTAQAVAVVVGLASVGVPMIWAGVTGRGSLLEDARDRLDAMRDHIEAYHAGRLKPGEDDQD